MSRFATRSLQLNLILSLGLATVGCSSDVGGDTETGQAELALIDLDGDGIPDGIDIDGDGVADFSFDSLCADPLVDPDQDGIPDGLDYDCDGIADQEWCTSPLLDVDNDGSIDGIDFDCDGVLDLGVPEVCKPATIDSDGDGVTDDVDLDCDGEGDLGGLEPDQGPADPGDPMDPDPTDPDPTDPGVCTGSQLLDENGDGIPDAIDLDCDGEADFRF